MCVWFDWIFLISGESGTLCTDIKSDNILVEMRGGTMHAKIIDLGLAGIKRIENSAVTADRLRGTIPYCAPEVCVCVCV